MPSQKSFITSFKSKLLLSLFFLNLFLPTVSFSEPSTLQLLGGISQPNLWQTSVAYIETPDRYGCSGILVGEREILTAAHCVFFTSGNVSDFVVIVGGKEYSVQSASYNPRWNPLGNAEYANDRFDLGVLILSTPVTDVLPWPIITDLQWSIGDGLYAFGYGVTENSGTFNLEGGSRSTIYLNGYANGCLLSDHIFSDSSTCSGDSGGPLASYYGGFFGLAGIISAGTNYVNPITGTCEQGYTGESIFVDLQSSYSRQYLSSFPGIKYIEFSKVYVFIDSNKTLSLLPKFAEDLNLAKLQKKARDLIKRFSNLRNWAVGDRLPLMNSLIKSLRGVTNARSAKVAQKRMRNSILKVQAIVNLGIE